MGDFVVKMLEFGGIVQEFDQFLYFVFGFFYIGYVGEGGFDLVFVYQLGFGFVECYWFVVVFIVVLYLVYEEDEDCQDQQNWQYGQE